MKKLIIIATIGIISYSIFIGITSNIKESEVYKISKEVMSIGKEFTNRLLNKESFIDNDLVKIKDINISRRTTTMVISFLLQNNSSSRININLDDVKVDGINQEVYISYNGENSVDGSGEDLYASYALLDVDLTSESALNKEFLVEGYIVIQDYESREILDKYKFKEIYTN